MKTGDRDINCDWFARNDPQNLGGWLEELAIRGEAETISTAVLFRLASKLRRVLEIPRKDHQWKILARNNNNNNNNNNC